MEMTVNAIVLVVALTVVGLSFTKFWADSKTRFYIQSAIDFADKIGGTNRDKLVRAITFVENAVLAKVPAAFKNIVDYFINPNKIADLIERRITENKAEKK